MALLEKPASPESLSLLKIMFFFIPSKSGGNFQKQGSSFLPGGCFSFYAL
jgi:hypothetical protein